VIFQQPDTITNEPTRELEEMDDEAWPEEETSEMAAIVLTSQKVTSGENAHLEGENGQHSKEVEISTPLLVEITTATTENAESTENTKSEEESKSTTETHAEEVLAETDSIEQSAESAEIEIQPTDDEAEESKQGEGSEVGEAEVVEYEIGKKTTEENEILSAEDRLNDEIEELLELLGLSQSMVKVTNEMIGPPQGRWEPPQGYRAIINPGGVGQPRDGDPRAAFMIYDSEQETFTFHRLDYDYEKTQEKIIQAGLPQYLAVRLAYGR
jgi:diadenosine tetraphosphatase ApaH/serine/threonine PP2A family protein phosphatase